MPPDGRRVVETTVIMDPADGETAGVGHYHSIEGSEWKRTEIAATERANRTKQCDGARREAEITVGLYHEGVDFEGEATAG